MSMSPDQWAGLGSLVYLGSIGLAGYGLYRLLLCPPRPEAALVVLPGPTLAEGVTALLADVVTPAAHADAHPVVDHSLCAACSDELCGCETSCEEFQRDVCSHWGKPFCASCAPHNCPDCRDEQARWDR
ncbi:hypothetical protein [Nocardioides sp. L-11A]|uniref:hypothetical protein n=1 Tax=Nocardioides sp. L-11A TaxID=3043848 RepID=UPI00249CE2CD|nr:hypothetical protein QJ852_10020 [Nocardioides sp. L-11A]